MAIVNSEYGPVDSVTGRPVATTESGMFYADTGEAYSSLQPGPIATPTGYQSEYVRWAGGPGQPVEYKRPDGTWVSGGAPEHAESAAYLQRAFSDPQVEQLFKFAYEHPDSLNNEQTSFMANPVLGLDSVGQGARWGNLNLFDDKFNAQQAGGLLQTGGSGYLSDADKSAGAAFNFEQSPAEQSKRDDDGGFGDLLPMIALVGIGIATGGFGMFGAGAAGSGAASSLAAADAMAGIGAMEFGAGSGLISSIGTNAMIGAGKSLVTGGDPLEGAILGGVGGAISGSGMLGDVSGGLIDATGATGAAATAITKGVNAAATGAIGALANGGSFSDVLSGGVVGGLTSGVGNYAAGTLLPGTNSTVAGGAGGAASGLIQAALTGGDIGSGILTGGLAGAASGLAKDMGAGPVTAGAVGALTGGLIKSAVQQDPVSAAKSFNPPPAISTTPAAGKFGLSFSDIIPQFSNKKVPWGTRLSGA